MSLGESLSPLVGRCILAWYFFSQALARIFEWDAMVVLARMKHVPLAPLLLGFAILAMSLGAIALLVGFLTRFSALMLACCTLGWMLIAHDFWTLRDPLERAADYQTFALGAALTGGLLILVGRGAGKFAWDARET
jgi:putative oxidoreductase